jgi:hypothetical protein
VRETLTYFYHQFLAAGGVNEWDYAAPRKGNMTSLIPLNCSQNRTRPRVFRNWCARRLKRSQKLTHRRVQSNDSHQMDAHIAVSKPGEEPVQQPSQGNIRRRLRKRLFQARKPKLMPRLVSRDTFECGR